jgi:hypothetical protein
MCGEADEKNVASEALTETYGVLTVGAVTSGTVAVGQQVTDPTGHVHPLTAIESNLSGSGNGSKWVVDTAQRAASEAMTMTAAPISVNYRAITGATENSAAFWIEQNGNFPVVSSTMTYASGTAAASLRLTSSSGAYLSTPGQLVTSPSAWMNNLVENENSEWSSFQTTFAPNSSTAASLATWAQSMGGQFQYLQNYATATPRVGVEVLDSAGASVNAYVAAVRYNADGVGNLLLDASGLTITCSSENESVTAGSDTFAVNPCCVGTTIENGRSKETFVYSSGFGHDAIAGFLATTTSHDLLQFSHSIFGFSATSSQTADAQALLSNFASGTTNTVITDQSGDSLTLRGVTIATLEANLGDLKFT